MPLPALKTLAEETNIPLKTVEKLYKESQAEAYENYGKDSGDFYTYSMGILKDKLKLETANIETADNNYADNFLVNTGKALNNTLKKTGALETIVNLGLTSLTGINGKQLNDSLGTSDSLHNKSNKWFEDLSAQAQKQYKEEHPDSEVVKEAEKNNKIKPITTKKPNNELEQDRNLNEEKPKNLENKKKENPISEKIEPTKPIDPKKPTESIKPIKPKKPTKAKRRRFNKKPMRYRSAVGSNIIAKLLEFDKQNAILNNYRQVVAAAIEYQKRYKEENSVSLKNNLTSFSKLDDKILSTRKVWLNALKSPSKKQVLAAQLEIMYKLGAPETITNMIVGDVRKHGNGLKLAYLDTAGKEQVNVITPTTELSRRLIKIICKLAEDKEINSPLWTYKDKVTSSVELQGYLKSISGVSAASLSNVKHSLGNNLMHEVLSNCKLDRDIALADLEKIYKKTMKIVAAKIARHTQNSVTLKSVVKNYVAASLQREVFETFNLKAPSFIPKN